MCQTTLQEVYHIIKSTFIGKSFDFNPLGTCLGSFLWYLWICNWNLQHWHGTAPFTAESIPYDFVCWCSLYLWVLWHKKEDFLFDHVFYRARNFPTMPREKVLVHRIISKSLISTSFMVNIFSYVLILKVESKHC